MPNYCIVNTCAESTWVFNRAEAVQGINRSSRPTHTPHTAFNRIASPVSDGVLDQMYGGGDGSTSEERDSDSSDEQQGAEMAEDMMADDSEGDERVGGGITHSDFFDEDG